MNYPSKDSVRRICVLASALFILPALVHAQTLTTAKPKPVPVVPETNPALVLIPFMGAVVLLFSRRLFRIHTATDKS
jgi:hypothetical protein